MRLLQFYVSNSYLNWIARISLSQAVSSVIGIVSLKVDGKACLGVKVELPDSPPLLLVIAEKGFVMCGLLNIDAVERLNATAAMVSGVKSFEDVLDAHVKAVTSKAKSLGVEAGMSGASALKHMS
jgi:uncharacterized protein YunC (DUF1805 family)